VLGDPQRFYLSAMPMSCIISLEEGSPGRATTFSWLQFQFVLLLNFLSLLLSTSSFLFSLCSCEEPSSSCVPDAIGILLVGETYF
jgi:hypothetical protein